MLGYSLHELVYIFPTFYIFKIQLCFVIVYDHDFNMQWKTEYSHM